MKRDSLVGTTLSQLINRPTPPLHAGEASGFRTPRTTEEAIRAVQRRVTIVNIGYIRGKK